MNSKTLLLITAFIIAPMSGCSHAPLGKDFNEANANNIEVQTINPKAGKEERPLATLDGEKSEKVLEHYRTETGEAPYGKLLTNMK